MTLISERSFLSGLIPQTLSFASCLLLQRAECWLQGNLPFREWLCCTFAMDLQRSKWSWIIMFTHLCNASSGPWMKGPTVQKYKVALWGGGGHSVPAASDYLQSMWARFHSWKGGAGLHSWWLQRIHIEERQSNNIREQHDSHHYLSTGKNVKRMVF